MDTSSIKIASSPSVNVLKNDTSSATKSLLFIETSFVKILFSSTNNLPLIDTSSRTKSLPFIDISSNIVKNK